MKRVDFSYLEVSSRILVLGCLCRAVYVCLTYQSCDVIPMFRYGEHSIKNGKYWDSRADPSVSIDSRRFDTSRKGHLVSTKEGEGRRKGKRGDANILFGMEGKKCQNV